jgi:hypothetical protein
MDRPLAILVWLALGVYGLSLLGAWLARPLPQPVPDPVAPVAPARAEATWREPLVGFSLNVHHTTQLPRYLESIDQIALLGCNALQVVTPVFCVDGASDRITIEVGPGRGPSREDLVALLRHAKSRGLRTLLMPIVLFTAPRGNEWRGKLNPPAWEPWWLSYQAMTDHFVAIAAEAQVDLYCVGSELLTTERQVDRWRGLIARVRRQFNGELIYSTNWDHYQVPALWRDLDYIGVSGYWNLTQGSREAPPSDADLARRWSQIRGQLLDYATAQGKPILITELGYPSLPWGLRDPWNYVNSQRLPADPQTQARGYASFTAAFGDLLPRGDATAIAGVLFYAWDPYRSGGEHDTGYGVRGKPALTHLQRWLRSPADP